MIILFIRLSFKLTRAQSEKEQKVHFPVKYSSFENLKFSSSYDAYID